MFLATQQEILDMTTTAPSLIALKLAVIEYHNGDNMDYLQKNIARDACYTSNNSLAYKKRQMADAIGDFESAITEDRDVLAERLCQRIESMEVELEELIERHEADKGVYLIIADGEEWTASNPTTRTKSKGNLSDKVAAMKAKVGA